MECDQWNELEMNVLPAFITFISHIPHIYHIHHIA
jgi:hypothetical protein